MRKWANNSIDKIFVGQKSKQTFAKLTILLFITTVVQAQEPEIDRLMKSELKMTFPSIYFKHNSTEYTTMPYSADSSFKFIELLFIENLKGFELELTIHKSFDNSLTILLLQIVISKFKFRNLFRIEN